MSHRTHVRVFRSGELGLYNKVIGHLEEANVRCSFQKSSQSALTRNIIFQLLARDVENTPIPPEGNLGRMLVNSSRFGNYFKVFREVKTLRAVLKLAVQPFKLFQYSIMQYSIMLCFFPHTVTTLLHFPHSNFSS